ncbi:MAG TPA: hypothetical protein VFF28_03535 [Candidatus Nanoarchaeia archaeon]|nr:hypothetical protein [Candidatus Nanoarchaeia archaeon]
MSTLNTVIPYEAFSRHVKMRPATLIRFIDQGLVLGRFEPLEVEIQATTKWEKQAQQRGFEDPSQLYYISDLVQALGDGVWLKRFIEGMCVDALVSDSYKFLKVNSGANNKSIVALDEQALFRYTGKGQGITEVLIAKEAAYELMHLLIKYGKHISDENIPHVHNLSFKTPPTGTVELFRQSRPLLLYDGKSGSQLIYCSLGQTEGSRIAANNLFGKSPDSAAVALDPGKLIDYAPDDGEIYTVALVDVVDPKIFFSHPLAGKEYQVRQFRQLDRQATALRQSLNGQKMIDGPNQNLDLIVNAYNTNAAIRYGSLRKQPA